MSGHTSEAFVGQRVYYYVAADAAPAVGFVTALHMGTQLQVSVINPAFRLFSVHEGVKHRSDPTMKEGDWENGAWDFGPFDRPVVCDKSQCDKADPKKK